jgi:hypothetical protein
LAAGALVAGDWAAVVVISHSCGRGVSCEHQDLGYWNGILDSGINAAYR